MEPLAGLFLSSSSPSACHTEAAWEELIGRYGPGLKARVGSVLRRSGMRPRREQVEEIVQEVYCRLLAAAGRRLRRCRATSESQVGAFLGRVAERVALDQLRAARAQKRGGALAPGQGAPLAWGAWCGCGWDPRQERHERAADPRANPEERMLSRERMRLFLERCGALAGRRDYRRNARILALAAAGMSSGEIARALGGSLTARSIDGLLPRVRRYVAAHASAAAAGLELATRLAPPPRGPARGSRAPAGLPAPAPAAPPNAGL
jgi:DNA-directed RNA polymerase specialized sigma24 family protein